MKTKEQLLIELETFKPTKRPIVEQEFGINEYDVISYIIGPANLKQLFPSVQLSGRQASIEVGDGIAWLKQTLKKQNYWFDNPGTHQEYMLYLNGKLDPGHRNAGSSIKDMLKFAKDVANGVNAVAQIGEQWREALHDLETVKGHPTAQAQAQKEYKSIQNEFIAIQGEARSNLSYLISRIQYFLSLYPMFENNIGLEKLNKIIEAYNNVDWDSDSIMVMEYFNPRMEGHYTPRDILQYLESKSMAAAEKWTELSKNLLTLYVNENPTNVSGAPTPEDEAYAKQQDLEAFNIFFKNHKVEAIDISYHVSKEGPIYWKVIPTGSHDYDPN
jgi:hypothetical protein